MVIGVGAAAALILNAFQNSIQLFYSPTEVVEGKVPDGAEFKIGGLVAADSVVRDEDGITTQFDLTDNGETVSVRYTGILPDLFREGQGTVSVGSLNDNGVFVAKKVLAKHDENYMPPEVADALQKAGDKHGSATVNFQ